MAAQASKSASGVIAAVAVLLGLVLGGGGVAVWAKSVTDPITPKERKATLHIDKGTVEIRDSKDATPRMGSQGDLLTEGMVVKADKDSQEAELRFFDSSVTRLAAETELTIANIFIKMRLSPAAPWITVVFIVDELINVYYCFMQLVGCR